MCSIVRIEREVRKKVKQNKELQKKFCFFFKKKN